VIARDRGLIYSEAATKGAPHALQVADRWHLLHNLADAVEEVLLQHRPALRAAVAAPAPVDTAAPVPFALPDTAPGPLTPKRPRQGQQRLSAVSQQRHARLVEQYQTIQQLAAAGVTVTESADQLGVSRRTVYRYRALAAPPEPRRVHRSWRRRVLTPFEPYLLQRWQEGCHIGMRLYRELRERGYTHGASNVMRFVAQLRREDAVGQPAGTAARARAGPTPTARHVAGLFLRRPETLNEEERGYLTRLLVADAAVGAAYDLTQAFAVMVRERAGERLDAWLDQADASWMAALRRFAKGLRADLAAIRAGLTVVWSNGQTEGHVHRLKLLKRQMYGRAGFAVLRQRVLLAG
jgi:transposase